MLFFDIIFLKLGFKPKIWSGKQQIVRIVNDRKDKLHTRVKHVDIHQLWIRQEIEASNLHLVWVTTKKRPAN